VNAPFLLQTDSPVEVAQHVRWAAWPWLCLAALAVVDLVWLAATPLRLGGNSLTALVQAVGFCAGGLLLVRHWGHHPRLYSLCMGGAFLAAAWPTLRLFNHLTMTTAFPYADTTLASWDAAIGFDWLAYVRSIESIDWLYAAMDLTYSGLSLYSCILFLLLCVGREPEKRCLDMILLFFGTAVICSSVGMLLPARAALAHYAPDPELFENLNRATGLYHLPAIHALRTDPAHMLDLWNLPGLVTFPSFHTAMGVVAIYCSRGTPWLFWPSLAVNLVMIASTPVFGSHYGIDVIAGAAVACGAILALRRLSSNNTCRIRSGWAWSPSAAVPPT
jgi:membrane-associated phospholipid phosphatase